jgi:hypothetical protein
MGTTYYVSVVGWYVLGTFPKKMASDVEPVAKSGTMYFRKSLTLWYRGVLGVARLGYLIN